MERRREEEQSLAQYYHKLLATNTQLHRLQEMLMHLTIKFLQGT